MTIVTVMIFFAFFIERSIEKFVSKKEKTQPYLVALAVIAGIVIAVGFDIDAVTELLKKISSDTTVVTRIPFLGHIISGIAMGFGSTFIHDLFANRGTDVVVKSEGNTTIETKTTKISKR